MCEEHTGLLEIDFWLDRSFLYSILCCFDFFFACLPGMTNLADVWSFLSGWNHLTKFFLVSKYHYVINNLHIEPLSTPHWNSVALEWPRFHKLGADVGRKAFKWSLSHATSQLKAVQMSWRSCLSLTLPVGCLQICLSSNRNWDRLGYFVLGAPQVTKWPSGVETHAIGKLIPVNSLPAPTAGSWPWEPCISLPHQANTPRIELKPLEMAISNNRNWRVCFALRFCWTRDGDGERIGIDPFCHRIWVPCW